MRHTVPYREYEQPARVVGRRAATSTAINSHRRVSSDTSPRRTPGLAVDPIIVTWLCLDVSRRLASVVWVVLPRRGSYEYDRLSLYVVSQ